MFERLQQKWKVSGLKLALILVTFALGGSATGYLGKKIMNVFSIQQDWLWAIAYILLITLLWPLSVLVVSIPFGQFPFFLRYIQKIGEKMGLARRSEQTPKPAMRLAIFASGAGSNAQKIIDRFRDHPHIHVELIVCNKPGAGVLSIAQKENIPVLLIEKERFSMQDGYLEVLKAQKIGFLVLAGFLWKIPASLIRAYPKRIVNIHPALLPQHGGKGMYGAHVHESVLASGASESGITIHYVDEHYDNGDIIFQARCPVHRHDTAETIAGRIHALEHEHYPRIIEELVMKVI